MTPTNQFWGKSDHRPETRRWPSRLTYRFVRQGERRERGRGRKGGEETGWPGWERDEQGGRGRGNRVTRVEREGERKKEERGDKVTKMG
jgi:hypothetical protein